MYQSVDDVFAAGILLRIIVKKFPAPGNRSGQDSILDPSPLAACSGSVLISRVRISQTSKRRRGPTVDLWRRASVA